MWLYGILTSYVLVVATALSSTATEEPQPTPSTIVDILSSDVQYSYFLRSLQLNGLIPLLNSLENVTILAPVNSAFAEIDHKNIKDVTDSWLRYIISQKVRIGYLGKKDVVFQTLYDEGKSNYTLKISPNFDTLEYMVDDIATVLETDVYAKHQHSFIQAIDSLLPKKQDICSILLDKNTSTLNNYPISFLKSVFKSLFCEFNDSRTLCFPNTYDHDKITKKCELMFKDKSTVFIPTDRYVNDSLPNISQKYYSALVHHQHDIAITKEAFNEIKDDVIDFFRGIIVNDLVGGENGTHNKTYKSLNKNSKFHINLDNNGFINVNNKIKSAINGTNIVLSNGIIHLFDSQDSSNFFTDLRVNLVDLGIPKKALYALHFSNYVRDLEYNSLGKFINTSSKNSTFIISLNQRDDIEDEQIAIESSSFKQFLTYHISDEFFDINNSNIENHNILLDSKLCSKKRIGSCFKIKLSSMVNGSKTKIRINDDASVIWDPIILSNNTAIYVTDKDISPPSTFKKELINLLSKSLDFSGIDRESCLKTIEHINEFDLFSLNENGKGYTAFLPCAKSKKGTNSNPWDSLGLIFTHLQSNPNLFKHIFNGLFLESLIYSNTVIKDELNFMNLNGDTVIIDRVGLNSSDIIRMNNTLLNLSSTSDYLFNQGVIHVIDEVILPDDFEISLLDLIKTTFNSRYTVSILDIINKVPHLSEELGIETNYVSPYSVLVPKPEYIQNLELVTLKDFTNFMSLHLIPNTGLDILFHCLNDDGPMNNSSHYIIETKHSNSVLICHKSGNKYEAILNLISKDKLDNLILSYNKDHEVKITSHGCTRHLHQSNQSCVFLIDKPINLSWLNDDKDFLHIHIGFISIGIGMLFGFFVFGILLYSVMFYQRKPDKGNGNKLIIPDITSHHNPTFMKVMNNEDSNIYDRGYETDIEGQNEGDSLLPMHIKRYTKDHSPNANYGAIDKNVRFLHRQLNESNPRGIGAKNIPNVLNRYKNLPNT